MKFGRRALNKAKTRISILNAVYRLTEEVSFRDLKIKDIAEEAEVTEMTFFNYYPKKEDILRYMMGLWGLDLLVLQHQSPLAGEAAIRRVFQHTALHVKKHPSLMAGFISYLVTNEIASEANEIEAADRYLLYPDIPEIYETRIPGGNEVIMKHLYEIDPSADQNKTLLHLASCFYGDILIAHTANLDLEALYSNSLDLIFKAL